jgi:hypothetical protein
VQSSDMDTQWASDNLQVIRTLMERSALYRRALAPVMLYAGALGTAGGVLGSLMKIETPRGFVLQWFLIGFAAVAGSLLLVRKQALKDAEPFWSAPTRHVSQALTPPLFAGAVAGILSLAAPTTPDLRQYAPVLLPPLWMILYGCALTAASFFMRRGIRVLGWIFILLGLLLAGLEVPNLWSLRPVQGHWIMGASFGVVHVLCGGYLYFTEGSANQE